MKHVICPSCGNICIKHGRTTAGSQRWRCKKCLMTVTPKIDNTSKQLQIFLRWLFGKQSQKEMMGEHSEERQSGFGTYGLCRQK